LKKELLNNGTMLAADRRRTQSNQDKMEALIAQEQSLGLQLDPPASLGQIK